MERSPKTLNTIDANLQLFKIHNIENIKHNLILMKFSNVLVLICILELGDNLRDVVVKVEVFHRARL